MSHRSGWFQVDTTAEIWRWRFSTATLAKYRLSKIIECDRAAVPCGRWVRLNRITWGQAFQSWRMQNALTATPVHPPKLRQLFDKRPRYRWSERR